MNVNLAYELAISKEEIRCDTQCKRILSIKSILAWILKYCVSDFSTFSISQIQHCIEGTPEISTVGVLPGSPKAASECISGMPNESKILNEGFITYDIRFSVTYPQEKKQIRLLINVEAQNSFYPGYQIVTRGIFYDARMISAQLGTEFSIPDYDNIKKVYSIWLCFNAPNYIGNAISKYQITKEDIVSGIPDRPWAYAKISVVLITLTEKFPTEHKLLRLLNMLFSNEIPYTQKLNILEKDYDIQMTHNERKELTNMCNYSAYVKEVGIQEGSEQTKRKIIENLLRSGLLSDEIIAKTTDYALEKILAIKSELGLTAS